MRCSSKGRRFFRHSTHLNNYEASVADPGGGGGGADPPLLGHDVGFLTLGPKLDPLLDPPFFACRPKMDPSGGSRVCVCDRGDHPPL